MKSYDCASKKMAPLVLKFSLLCNIEGKTLDTQDIFPTITIGLHCLYEAFVYRRRWAFHVNNKGLACSHYWYYFYYEIKDFCIIITLFWWKPDECGLHL